MTLPLYIIDAFARGPFTGNPAAVCLLDGPRDDERLQAVAAEMNLSETAFLLPEGEHWRLRWFTPTVEVDLCGHATLAAAHFLWATARVEGPPTFETRSGRLTARRAGDEIELDFPALVSRPCPEPEGLTAALGTELLGVWNYGLDYLVEVADAATVRDLRPDIPRLAALRTRGVVVTAAAPAEVDFVSRFFAPAAGVAEDPVTGSAHCALTPFWAARLGKVEMRGRQLSRRGGEVGVRLADNRVLLRGKSVTVMRGEIEA